MAVGVVHTVRDATQTNTVSHNYSYNSVPSPDEESFGDGRFYDSYDLTAGINSGEYNGTTADGTILRTETVLAGEIPVPQE